MKALCQLDSERFCSQCGKQLPPHLRHRNCPAWLATKPPQVERQHKIVEERSAERRRRRRSAALATGVASGGYDAFIAEVGHPPGCYDKRCWWFVKFERRFGADAAAAIKDALLGG